MPLVLGDGSHELLAQHTHAVLLLHDLVVAMILKDDFVKERLKPDIDVRADPVQAKVHAEEHVGVGCDHVSGQALVVP